MRPRTVPGILPNGLLLALTAMVAACLPLWAKEPRPAPLFKRPFGELFLYGQISLLPGSGLLYPPGKTRPVSPSDKELHVPVNSILETRASETATLRFGSGSRIVVGPNSRLKICRFSLEVAMGSLLVRHHGSAFPLLLTGSQSLRIPDQSLVELVASGAEALVRVQAGSVTVGKDRTTVSVGETVRIADDRVVGPSRDFVSSAWFGSQGDGVSDSELDQVFGVTPPSASASEPLPEPVSASETAVVGEPASQTGSGPAESPPPTGGVTMGEDE